MAMRFDDSQLKSGLSIFEQKVDAAMQMYAETVSKDFESYAKENRPWTDRTGQARQRLNGYVEDMKNGKRVCLAHGVDYGIFLEYCHEKRFAILEPTIRLKGPDAVSGFKTMMNGIKVY